MNIGKLKKYIFKKVRAEIPKNLTYHGIHHTIEVIETCNRYIKRMHISAHDAYLLRTAALMHDIGIMWNYFNHEDQGIKYVKELLPKWSYTVQDIEVICNLIHATRLPQSPATILEQILCDADVDYLGTDQFYRIGQTLYKEFLEYKVVTDDESWDRLQVKFLSNHHYITPFGIKFREPIKQKHLNMIKEKWAWS